MAGLRWGPLACLPSRKPRPAIACSRILERVDHQLPAARSRANKNAAGGRLELTAKPAMGLSTTQLF